MYLFCKQLSKMTQHEDLGLDSKGRHLFKCTESGEIRGLSKAKKEAIVEKRALKKESDRKFFEENGGSDNNPRSLKLTKDQILSIKETLDSNKQN